jgi:hypothetical protein
VESGGRAVPGDEAFEAVPTPLSSAGSFLIVTIIVDIAQKAPQIHRIARADRHPRRRGEHARILARTHEDSRGEALAGNGVAA